MVVVGVRPVVAGGGVFRGTVRAALHAVVVDEVKAIFFWRVQEQRLEIRTKAQGSR